MSPLKTVNFGLMSWRMRYDHLARYSPAAYQPTFNAKKEGQEMKFAIGFVVGVAVSMFITTMPESYRAIYIEAQEACEVNGQVCVIKFVPK